MKFIVMCFCLVAVAQSAPAKSNDNHLRQLPAVLHEEVHDKFGQYSIRYVTAENTVVSERGRLVPSKNGGFVLEIDGQYQFVGDDGVTYVTNYKGGPDGFHVEGQHLPKPVSVPKIP